MSTFLKSLLTSFSGAVPHPAWIEVNLTQFQKNLKLIREAIGKTRLLCVPVKANAYGHGLVPMALVAEKSGADYLAVSCLQEGVFLREAGVRCPILLMGAIHEAQVPGILQHALEPTVASSFKAELLQKACEASKQRCRVHIEVDTGMRRTGMRPETALQLIQTLASSSLLEVVGIYSHLAMSDVTNHPSVFQQQKLFNDMFEKACGILGYRPLSHLANSGAVCYYPDTYGDMVRVGLLSFGYFLGELPSHLQGIRPFLSLKANIAYFKVLEADEGVSYGHTFRSKKQTRLVTIPVGYGDGYRRALSNRAQVLIRGKRYPVVGMVCMDQLMVNLGNDEAFVGETVVLIGEQQGNRVRLEEIAAWCDTIPYEILCGLNDRLPRVYTE